MEIFGVGWMELFFILIIILLVAGPKDLQRGARGLGRLLNRIYKSPNYHAIRRASDELRNLPQRLAREANLEELDELRKVPQELQKELKETANTIGSAPQEMQAWVKDLSKPPTPPPPSPPAAPPPAATTPDAAEAAAPTEEPAGKPAHE
jgi:Sec-independent protein translocase protein TatA